MRSSYSQTETYKNCAQHWYYRYVDKLEGSDIGASTFFGTAVDAAVMYLLETNNLDFKDKFVQLWLQQEDKKQKKPLKILGNNSIIFAHADFDKDVLDEETKNLLHAKLVFNGLDKELGTDDPVEAYFKVAKAKRNKYKAFPEQYLDYFNFCSWYSMLRKGIILLDSFYEQFYPKIEKVLATQKFALIKDDSTGDIIQGVVDTVLLLKGHDKPIIFDLKTSSRPYTDDQIEHSDQLTLYAAMEGRKYNTDQVGYIVLCKNINKVKEYYCSTCGSKRESKHRTCNQKKENDTIRCGGDWLETVKLDPKVQVLIRTKSTNTVNKCLEDQANIIVAMKNNVVFKNNSKCESWYGNRCVYYNLCKNGSTSGLTKRS